MIDSPKLIAAIEAAERFLSACNDVRELEREAQSDCDRRKASAIRPENVFKHVSRVSHAAAKRASMDLTRALAQLRKPGAF